MALRSALGRVLADDVVSPIDVPAHDNSAMDGYALRGSDLADGADARSRVVGTGFAGQPVRRRGAGRRVRAHHDRRGDAGRARHRRAAGVRTRRRRRRARSGRASSERGDNRRLAGEDLARGEAALPPAACCARPTSACSLRSAAPRCRCFRRLRVAFFSTGDELRSIGEPLDAGCVYDSNRYTLWACCSDSAST